MSSTQAIKVGVAETKFYAGVADLAQKGQWLDQTELLTALGTVYPTDAHFFSYKLSGVDVPSWPRLNKIILPKVRAAGYDIYTDLMVFDIDTPNHVDWPQYMPVDDFLKWFHTDFAKVQPWVLHYFALYTTKAGLRLIYVLPSPIAVDVAEQKHIWLNNELIKSGLLTADSTACEWNRCFRLARVNRDGKRTDLDPSFRIYVNPSFRLQVDQVPTNAEIYKTATKYRDIKPFNEPKPDLLHSIGLAKKKNKLTGVEEPADWIKLAKSKLKKAKCFACLFKQATLAEKGSRNNTLLSYVGEAIAILMPYNSFSPAHIFSLFLPVVDTLEPDAGNRDWSDTLWRMIGDTWAKEEAKEHNRSIKVSAEQVSNHEKMEMVISGMQEWDKSPELWSPSAVKYARSRLIAASGTSYFVMTRSGHYDSLGVNSSSLVPRIKQLGMEDVIEIKGLTATGAVKELNSQTIINEHGFVVSRIEGKPCIGGGIIEHQGKDNVLVIPTYNRRTDIVPRFNNDVDLWLHKLFGDNYLAGIEWLAWSLAFDQGAICALSISGHPGIGKKLLLQGLAECLDNCEIASADDMIGSYNYGLMNTPFLNVDEGWPKTFGGSDPADAFRHLVTGQPIMVKRKYHAPIKVYNPIRIILTANDLGLIEKLGMGKDLTPEALAGLAQRIRHFKIGKAAAVWLAERGGHKFTAAEGNRWIQGDTGEPSDYVLARHFLFLHQRRGPTQPGTRLLVDGDIDGSVMDEIRSGSGITNVVIEALLSMSESTSPDMSLYFDGVDLYVTVDKIIGYIRRANLLNPHDMRLNDRSVRTSLRTICKEEPEIASVKRDVKAAWWKLDTLLLAEKAVKLGKHCPRLINFAKGKLLA